MLTEEEKRLLASLRAATRREREEIRGYRQMIKGYKENISHYLTRIAELEAKREKPAGATR